MNVAEMKKTIQELKERNQLLADKISPVEPTVQEKVKTSCHNPSVWALN
jgi:hypothetical protein